MQEGLNRHLRQFARMFSVLVPSGTNPNNGRFRGVGLSGWEGVDQNGAVLYGKEKEKPFNVEKFSESRQKNL